MIGSLRLWLVVWAIVASALLVACGGDSDNGGDDGGTTEQPEATAPIDGGDAQDGGDADDGESADSGDGFGDVPVPAGADETGSGSFSGNLPFLIPGGDIDPGAFTTLEFKEYEVDQSPEEVINFYRDAMDDWDEVFDFSGGSDGDQTAVGIWARNEGQTAVFVTATRDDGTTVLTIVRGSVD